MSQRSIVTLSITLFLSGLIWGIYTLIYYLGVPNHLPVFLEQGAVNAILQLCNFPQNLNAETSSYLCVGARAFGSYISAWIQMLSPFYTYIGWSLFLGVGVMLYSAYRTGNIHLEWKGRPWHIIGLFFLSLWFLATTFMVGSVYNERTAKNQRTVDIKTQESILMPFRRMGEPLPQALSNGVSENGIKELRKDFESLLSRGCLDQIGSYTNGVRLFNIAIGCMQASFFERVGVQFLLVLFFILELTVLGSALLSYILRRAQIHPLLEFVLSIGLGTLVWIVVLWLLAIFKIFTFGPILLLTVLIPSLFWKQTKYWCTHLHTARFEVSLPWWFTVLAWALISYLALNFLSVVRPFPIGWDDIGSYLNRPHLLSSYGAFLPSMSQFQWEYLTAAAYTLLGSEEPIAATFAMEMTWAAGLFAVLAVYTFGRLFMGPKGGLIAAASYYMLPMVGHFSFADMKVDNAVFFTGALAILAASVALFPKNEDKESTPSQLLIVAGLLAGLSLGMKVTAILTILLIFSLFAGSYLRSFGFLASVLLSTGILIGIGAIALNAIAQRAVLENTPSQYFIAGVLLFLGIISICIGFWKYYKELDVKKLLLCFSYLCIGLAVSILPWALFNSFHNPSNIPFSSTDRYLKFPDVAQPQFFYSQEAALGVDPRTPVHILPKELALDESHPACKGSARTEELDRYWGFSKGWDHYLTLPWREVMTLDGFGYYVTLAPFLLLLPLVLLLPAFWRKENRWMRYLFAGSMVYLLHWMFTANGIMWYGIGMFFGFAVLLETLVLRSPDHLNRTIFGSLITISLIICGANRLWQFDILKHMMDYPLGKISIGALKEASIPHYDDVRDIVLQRHKDLPATPYTFRIGTFIPYFIPRNREILPVSDHQLTLFNCLNQERDHALTLKRLKALGFNSMIFDTNTATIERDPNGSLHQKVNAFLSFANDRSTGVNPVLNDTGVGIAFILLP